MVLVWVFGVLCLFALAVQAVWNTFFPPEKHMTFWVAVGATWITSMAVKVLHTLIHGTKL
jgi:hypothetical protein